jgi:transposase
MNPYPQNKSVLILDNCAIHKSHVLYEVVHAHGQLLIFLPSYSPDYNPIEESFSCGECSLHILLSVIFIYGLEQSRFGFSVIWLTYNKQSTPKSPFLKQHMQ